MRVGLPVWGPKTSSRTLALPWEINEKSLKGFEQENDLITLNVSLCLVSSCFNHGVQLTASCHWAGFYFYTDSNNSGNYMDKALTICIANSHSIPRVASVWLHALRILDRQGLGNLKANPKIIS